MSSLQRCPHYRGVLTTEVSSLQVSSLQRCPHYRGVLTTGVSSLQVCPHYRGVLTTEVSSLQVSSLQVCPHYRGVLTTGVLTTEVSSLQGCPHYRGVLTTGVSSLQRCPHYRGFCITLSTFILHGNNMCMRGLIFVPESSLIIVYITSRRRKVKNIFNMLRCNRRNQLYNINVLRIQILLVSTYSWSVH